MYSGVGTSTKPRRDSRGRVYGDCIFTGWPMLSLGVAVNGAWSFKTQDESRRVRRKRSAARGLAALAHPRAYGLIAGDGVRESAQSWKELLLDLKRRGLAMGPELAVADGALGFWQAVEEVWPRTRGQRCWVPKTANVLNKLPKSQQSKAKRALQEIWMAATKKDALAAFDAFIETWGVKYDKAVECLIKDRDALLAFYDFPAEHWKHLRTTNPIESSFA